MTVWVLITLVVILMALLTMACIRIEFLQWESKDIMSQDHAKCMAMVAAFVGDEFAAYVLNAAAKDYASMDGQAEIARIANTVWKEGDNIPALWMQERADSIIAKYYEEGAVR